MKIPTCMERFVGPGEMGGDLQIFDYPLLSMVMVNLQNDQARGAGDYAELTSMPEYMRHLCGDVKICPSIKTHIVNGQERRVRSSGCWVLYPMISDQEKVTVRRGTRYDKAQVSRYIERYFTPMEMDEDEEEVLKL